MKSNDFISFRLMCQWFGTCVEDIRLQLQSMTVSGQFGMLYDELYGRTRIRFPLYFIRLVLSNLGNKEKKMAKGIVKSVFCSFWESVLAILS